MDGCLQEFEKLNQIEGLREHLTKLATTAAASAVQGGDIAQSVLIASVADIVAKQVLPSKSSTPTEDQTRVQGLDKEPSKLRQITASIVRSTTAACLQGGREDQLLLSVASGLGQGLGEVIGKEMVEHVAERRAEQKARREQKARAEQVALSSAGEGASPQGRSPARGEAPAAPPGQRSAARESAGRELRRNPSAPAGAGGDPPPPGPFGGGGAGFGEEQEGPTVWHPAKSKGQGLDEGRRKHSGLPIGPLAVAIPLVA